MRIVRCSEGVLLVKIALHTIMMDLDEIWTSFRTGNLKLHVQFSIVSPLTNMSWVTPLKRVTSHWKTWTFILNKFHQSMQIAQYLSIYFQRMFATIFTDPKGSEVYAYANVGQFPFVESTKKKKTLVKFIIKCNVPFSMPYTTFIIEAACDLHINLHAFVYAHFRGTTAAPTIASEKRGVEMCVCMRVPEANFIELCVFLRNLSELMLCEQFAYDKKSAAHNDDMNKKCIEHSNKRIANASSYGICSRGGKREQAKSYLYYEWVRN